MSHILAAWPETCDCLNCRIIEVRRELSVLSDIDPTIPLTCENVSILRTETEESIAPVVTASPFFGRDGQNQTGTMKKRLS
ncbi:MAG: hypothetical protein JNM43_08595 [Planctomycetaceae bacterium]|nr:hypothetical protein [Planctomycetaceae bacterium]